MIAAFSAFAAQFADRIAEIEVNPLIVGRYVVAVDVLVVIKATETQ